VSEVTVQCIISLYLQTRVKHIITYALCLLFTTVLQFMQGSPLVVGLVGGLIQIILEFLNPFLLLVLEYRRNEQ
jgi:hypothetical protein